MSEINNDVKNELNSRKEILNKHLAKFNQLKNEEKWSEAWSQLLITLNYANDTLKYSANLLKDISNKVPNISSEQQEKIKNIISKQTNPTQEKNSIPKKMIVIPKKQNIH